MGKTKRIRSCSSPYVGVAQSHTIEDACQGIKDLFALFIFVFNSSLHSINSHFNICLPVHREIVFEDFTENGQCVFQRAWDDLLPNNRILIYCLYDMFSAVK